MIDWDPGIKKEVKYLRCLEGKGGLKEIHCIEQDAAPFVSYYKISCVILFTGSVPASSYI